MYSTQPNKSRIKRLIPLCTNPDTAPANPAIFGSHCWIKKACLPFAVYSTSDSSRIALILSCNQIQATPPKKKKKKRKRNVQWLGFNECVRKARRHNSSSLHAVLKWLSMIRIVGLWMEDWRLETKLWRIISLRACERPFSQMWSCMCLVFSRHKI